MKPGDYTSDPIEDGLYEAVVTEIVETKKFNNFKNEETDVLDIKFTIAEGEHADRYLTQTFNPVVNEKSNLMALLRTLLQRDPSVEEMARIETSQDIAKLIVGKNVMLVIKNRPGKKDPSRMYYGISDFMKSKRVNTPVQAKKKIEEMTDDEIIKLAEGLEV